jgi:NADH:ubiquinone oxidoreductase subunit H
MAAHAGESMNRKAIILLMTAGIFVVLGILMLLFFGGWPPWPVTLWFALSHVFFCVVIARVKPFRGPYREPMGEPGLPRVD